VKFFVVSLIFIRALFSIEQHNLPEAICFSEERGFSDESFIDLMAFIADRAELDKYKVSKISSNLFQPRRNTLQSCIFGGDKGYFVKLCSKKEEIERFYRLQLAQDLNRYNMETRGEQCCPKIIVPEYVCVLKDNSRVLNLCVMPFVEGKDFRQLITLYRRSEIIKETLIHDFNLLGCSLAYFQNYFLSDGLLTRQHGDPSFSNFILSSEGRVHFIDVSTMGRYNRLLPPEKEIKRFIYLTFYHYAGCNGGERLLMALETALTSFLEGYFNHIDERIRASVDTSVCRYLNELDEFDPNMLEISRRVCRQLIN
jgi:hypothetical protein